MKRDRGLRTDLAGAAVAFGFIVLAGQLIYFATAGLDQQLLEGMSSILSDVILFAHLFGSFVGGYLVARRNKKDFVMSGTIIAVLAYIFEFVYNIVLEGTGTSIWAFLSLILGGVGGAMFFGIRLERIRVNSLKGDSAQVAKQKIND